MKDEQTCKERILYLCDRIETGHNGVLEATLVCNAIELTLRLTHKLPSCRDVLVPKQDVSDREMAESLVLILKGKLVNKDIPWRLVLSILVQLLDRLRVDELA